MIIFLAGGLILIGSIWRLVKRFLKIWFVIVALLVCFKLAADAGWIQL